MDRIEIQDFILEDGKTERVVEVGPSNVLTNMIRRTWDKKYEARDLSRNLKRSFLGPQGGLEELYYQTSPSTEDGEEIQANGAKPSQPTDQGLHHQSPSSSSHDNVTLTELPQSAPSTAPTVVSDTPVLASSILQTLIATKLQTGSTNIATDKSISGLVGGRSTLSNEIIGDLLVEFPGRLPERSEEVPLTELAQILSTNHEGRLGKSTSSLVAKMVSSKFSGDYGLSGIRQILNDRWGLGPMRQDAVLLLALTKQPASRLTAPGALDAFLKEVVTSYLQQEGLRLPTPTGSGGGSSRGAHTTVDAKALEAVNVKNIALMKDIVGLLNSHLGEKLHGASATVSVGREVVMKSTKLLDMWLAELGVDFVNGIEPKFDMKKERLYDSYWNWTSEDIMRLSALCKSPSPEHVDQIGSLSLSIMNRADYRSITQLKYLISQAETAASGNKFQIKTLRLVYETCIDSEDKEPVFVDQSPEMAPLTIVDGQGKLVTSEIPRNAYNPRKIKSAILNETENLESSFPIGEFRDGSYVFSPHFSDLYGQDLRTAKDSGFTFAKRNVLLTGAGKNSIGFQMIRHLLSGGARVTVTTSSYSTETAQMYQNLYAKHGSKGSILRVVPFNQGSHQDVKNLVQWIGDDDSWDLDFIIPFAALSENGRDLESLDAKSEIAHRIMLTNLLRMLGAVAHSKRSRGIVTRPATIILPLSPNHGLMGNDGLYAESKRSLEALLAKWTSESWADYLSLIGVIIGWTRGTHLMKDNDTVAQAVETMGVKTFSTVEMAANIVTLMGGSINHKSQMGPLVVDLGGGMGSVRDFKQNLSSVRQALRTSADTQRAITQEMARDATFTADNDGNFPTAALEEQRLLARANVELPLPTLPDYDRDVSPLASSLEGMVDLNRVVVITGFAELGPHGNSRTRWEMEKDGNLSLEGSIEMAWIMGLIKHHSGPAKDGSQASGWVDAKTKAPVDEAGIIARYMSTILEHSGIRKIEPEICDNAYDPEQKESLQEIVLQRNLPPFETTNEVAENMKRKHGDKALVTYHASGDGCHVQLMAGATVMVPRATHFNRTVAGQIPTGWSAKRYGISDEIVDQVDPVTLFSLVCVVEALLCSGVTDPYEFYKHIHVSELGNCLGSSMGGLSSLRQMHRDRFLDRTVKGDVLQETFVNTTGAWINMLLTSSAGPIKTPVGACATSLESLDTGCDLIMARKAKVVLVGGVEDFVEDVSFEFGSMKATCDTDAEFARGRGPQEMSRPTASSRSGFVEAQGCGVQVLTSAELALKMGLPIYGIVAYTNMSADKAGRSVPAPGKGVLVNARESSEASLLPASKAVPWPLLDLKPRRRMLTRRRKQINDFVNDSLAQLEEEITVLRQQNTAIVTEEELQQYRQQHIEAIQEQARAQEADAAFHLGNVFWKSDERQRTSPIRGSLATWGLGIDDISVASLHGTSTIKNDLNEPMVIQEQMKHLGRREGNILPCICQKWLTGHSKGAAGAWMINGCLQMMDEGLVPGNRNADNVDERLRQHQHLLFPGTTLNVGDDGAGIKACSVTSFGFGQKGSQAILVHPRYLFATVTKERFQEYVTKREVRGKRASRWYSAAMIDENMVSACIKEHPPYAIDNEISVLLDASARTERMA